MKTLTKYLFALICLSMIFVACENPPEADILPQEDAMTAAKTRAVSEDTIVPLEGDRDTLRRPISTRAYDDNVREEIDQLEGIPFYIQVKGNSSYRQFLNATNKGSELTVEGVSEKINQQFYLRILPATSGIPYLIYSKQTGTPISIGSYRSNPEVHVLYALPDEKGSLFGASWDFLRAQYSPEAFVIENQDIPEQGSGGGYWDIYYNVVSVNDSKIYFEKYKQRPNQEFAIVPSEDFEMEEIKYNLDQSAVVTKMPDIVYRNSYTNRGPVAQSHIFTISDSYKETSSFNRKTSYSVKVSTEIKCQVPFIASGKISTEITAGQEFTYGTSQEKSHSVSYSYPVNIPANYKAQLTLAFYKYRMDVGYTAVCRGLTSGRKINIKGIWNGIDVVENDAVLELTPLNSSGAIKRMTISKEMLKSGRLIIVE